MNALIKFFLGAAILTAALLSGGEPDPITQPPQSKSGPGSTEYPHATFKQSSIGKGNTQIWIYEPDEPKPATAPVILFMHGWSAMDPGPYLAWIEHLARRGNIVFYPRYQAGLATPPETFTPNAVGAIKDALKKLEEDKERVQPDLTRFAALGHSYGGIIAANLAAVAKDHGLPPIKAVLAMEPGSNGFGKPYADYALIPKGTLLVCMAGDDDKFVGDRDAKRIFTEAVNVSKDDKDYIVLYSDKHGTPPQNANHFAPIAPKSHVDAHDYNGFWKWMDGLTDAAFFGKNRDYALGNTEKQRNLGAWSDGTPLKEPKVTDDP